MKNAKWFLIVVTLISVIGCSSSQLMVSSAVESKIVVDGNQEDWVGKLKYFADKQATIGFQNDENNLYFCLVTSNKQSVMKMMTLGLTIWFEPENGEQIIGLQYPKRMDENTSPNKMGKNRNSDNNSDFEMTINTMMQNQGEFVLVDEDEEILYASPVGSDGYEIKVSAANLQFVYEAKIPIGNNNESQMPIDIFPEEKFTIRFETGGIDLEEITKNDGRQYSGREHGNDGMYGSGLEGRGTMQGGSLGGVSRMGMERFRLDIEVKLAK
ncbi:MAG: hypothetical protein L3J41_13760 [Melioribacteraceae bacterium]|nr:hypothetical protein [Melioribacteraceae bacterium]